MKRIGLIVVTLGIVTLTASASERALTPNCWGGKTNCWQLARHREKLAEAKAKAPNVVFVGDSITHYWEEKENAEHWKGHLAVASYNALNLGFSSDCTEHVLWRITEGGELDGYQAKAVVLMIGTNNKKDGAETVAKAIRKILDVIAEKQPKATIILHPIFPRGAKGDKLRAKNDRTNEIIRGYADGQRIILCDFNEKFLDKDGDTKWAMPDHLHPNAYAYANIWFPAIEPILRRICREACRSGI